MIENRKWLSTAFERVENSFRGLILDKYISIRVYCDILTAWLHGELQPGLKFRYAHQAEILLQ